MVAFRHVVAVLLVSLSAACAQSSIDDTAPQTLPPQGLSFVVFGDTPYGDVDYPMLEKAVSATHSLDVPFVIHVGDYKGGGAPCTPDHDAFHLSLIASLQPMPVFYTPGDNEWTDCDRFKDKATGKRTSDLDRLEIVREMFFAEPVVVPVAFSYKRQPELVENASWVFDDVQFITLHVTGTNNGRDWVTGDPLERAQAAVDQRDGANRDWLAQTFDAAMAAGARAVVIAMQADMTDIEDKPDDVMCADVAPSDKHPCDGFTVLRAQIRDLAIEFGKPVLVIHGDTAPFTLNQEFSGEEAPNLWRLNAAGDAGIGRTGFPYGKRDVTLVTIDLEAEEVFSARGLLTGDIPAAK